MNRKSGWALAALAVALLASHFAFAQEVNWQKLAKIKAAFVLNFIKYTQWPNERFQSAGDPIVVTVLGHADILSYLDEAVRGQAAHGRPIEVRRLTAPRPTIDSQARSDDEYRAFLQSLRQTHVLYVGATEEVRLRDVLRALDGADVLTISDIPNFAEAGGMLGLVLRENRVGFDANPGEIKKSNLSVSSKVLKLARIVETQ